MRLVTCDVETRAHFSCSRENERFSPDRLSSSSEMMSFLRQSAKTCNDAPDQISRLYKISRSQHQHCHASDILRYFFICIRVTVVTRNAGPIGNRARTSHNYAARYTCICKSLTTHPYDHTASTNHTRIHTCIPELTKLHTHKHAHVVDMHEHACIHTLTKPCIQMYYRRVLS